MIIIVINIINVIKMIMMNYKEKSELIELMLKLKTEVKEKQAELCENTCFPPIPEVKEYDRKIRGRTSI